MEIINLSTSNSNYRYISRF